jgi:hypothetical protein
VQQGHSTVGQPAGNRATMRAGGHAGERARARGTTRDESFFRSIQTSKSLATPAFSMPFKDCLDFSSYDFDQFFPVGVPAGKYILILKMFLSYRSMMRAQ